MPSVNLTKAIPFQRGISRGRQVPSIASQALLFPAGSGELGSPGFLWPGNSLETASKPVRHLAFMVRMVAVALSFVKSKIVLGQEKLIFCWIRLVATYIMRQTC